MAMRNSSSSTLRRPTELADKLLSLQSGGTLNPALTAYVGSGASTGKIKVKFVAQHPGVEKHINDGQPDRSNKLAAEMLAKERADQDIQKKLLAEARAEADVNRSAAAKARAAKKPLKSQRFVSTMHSGMEEVAIASEKYRQDPSVKSFEEQRAENKLARKKLAGTQWQFGTDAEEDAWREIVKAGSNTHAGMKEIAIASEKYKNDPNTKSFAQQRVENKQARQKLAGTQWEYGSAIDPERFKQTDKVQSTIMDPPKGGVGLQRALTKQEMFGMMQKFKYGDGNKPWADGGEGSEVKQWTTGEIDRQTEITGAMKLTSSDEKAKERAMGKKMKAHLSRTQWEYGYADDLDCRRRTCVMMGNDQIMAAIEKDKKSPDKLSMSAQRIENKNRRKKLSGTYWSLGSEADMKSWEGSLTTDYQNQFKNHMTAEGLDILATSRQNGRDSKKRLQKSTLELGFDENFM